MGIAHGAIDVRSVSKEQIPVQGSAGIGGTHGPFPIESCLRAGRNGNETGDERLSRLKGRKVGDEERRIVSVMAIAMSRGWASHERLREIRLRFDHASRGFSALLGLSWFDLGRQCWRVIESSTSNLS